MSIRVGTIVRFVDGRVAVKKVTGAWEVSGTTRERYRDEELDEGFTVVYTPPKDVSGYGLGTIVMIGDSPYIKTNHSQIGGGTWTGIWSILDDAGVEESDFTVLRVMRSTE